jgi:hypothetical protein
MERDLDQPPRVVRRRGYTRIEADVPAGWDPFTKSCLMLPFLWSDRFGVYGPAEAPVACVVVFTTADAHAQFDSRGNLLRTKPKGGATAVNTEPPQQWTIQNIGEALKHSTLYDCFYEDITSTPADDLMANFRKWQNTAANFLTDVAHAQHNAACRARGQQPSSDFFPGPRKPCATTSPRRRNSTSADGCDHAASAHSSVTAEQAKPR